MLMLFLCHPSHKSVFVRNRYIYTACYMYVYICIYICVCMCRLLSKHFYLQLFFTKDWVSWLFTKSLFLWDASMVGKNEIWVSRLLKNAFLTHFLTSKYMLSIADKHKISPEYYGLVVNYTKSHHANQHIKVCKKPPRPPKGHTNFFCNQIWQFQLVMLSLDSDSLFYIWANIVQFWWYKIRAMNSFSAQSIFHSPS